MNEIPLSGVILPTTLRPSEQDASARQPVREKTLVRDTVAQGEYLPASGDYASMSDESEQRRNRRDANSPVAMYLETSEAQDTPERGQYLNLFA